MIRSPMRVNECVWEGPGAIFPSLDWSRVDVLMSFRDTQPMMIAAELSDACDEIRDLKFELWTC